MIRIATAGALVVLAALAPIAGTPSFAAGKERHVGGDPDMDGAPVECLRWPYPASCRIAGVPWHPNREQIEEMHGSSNEGLCWMWLNAAACAIINKTVAPERRAIAAPATGSCDCAVDTCYEIGKHITVRGRVSLKTGYKNKPAPIMIVTDRRLCPVIYQSDPPDPNDPPPEVGPPARDIELVPANGTNVRAALLRLVGSTIEVTGGAAVKTFSWDGLNDFDLLILLDSTEQLHVHGP
jgi:hypothetical protein